MPYIIYAFLLLSTPIVGAESKLDPPLSVREPAKGVLLVADRSMPDPRFQQTVILLLEHDDARGTLGLVLNRPSDMTLDDALPDSPYQDNPLPLGWGGPVSQHHIFMLWQSDEALEESSLVFDNLIWSASAKVLTTLLSEDYDTRPLRVFFGLASWAPGQLAGELTHDGWKLFEGQTGAVFYDGDPNALWQYFIDAPARILAHRS